VLIASIFIVTSAQPKSQCETYKRADKRCMCAAMLLTAGLFASMCASPGVATFHLPAVHSQSCTSRNFIPHMKLTMHASVAHCD
jgi:hypothetical protein